MSQIAVTIDLDSEQYKKGISEINIATRSIEDQANQTFAKTLPKSISTTERSLTSVNNSLSSLVGTATKVFAVATTLGYALAIAEKNFGLLTNVGNKLNINLVGIQKAVHGLIASFGGFATGEKTFGEVKLEAGLLLNRIGLLDNKMLSAINTARDLAGTNMSLVGSLVAVGTSSSVVVANYAKISSAASNLIASSGKMASTVFNVKGFFSLASSLATASAGFLLISEAAAAYEGGLARTISLTSKLAAIIMGGLAAAIGFTILKMAELGQVLSSKLVAGFINASDVFAKTENSTALLGASIDSMNRSISNVAGSYIDWESTVNGLSASLNLSRGELQKSAQEIVLVGSQLGLTADQMQKLLAVSAEYAKINKKDVFDVTVAITGALNGNAQAVTALGIKLNEASVMQYAFSKGITDSFEKMSESEKVQLRYNKLLKQYVDVGGIATVAAGSLADQEKALAVNVERLNTSLGRGASIIESNNIVSFALNKVLNNLSDSVLSTAGFLGALGARLLQVGSYVLEFSFKIYAVVKAIKILDILLATNISKGAFATSLPIIGKSLNDLLTQSSGATVQISSLNSMMAAMSATIKNSLFGSFTTLNGAGRASASMFTVLVSMFSKLKEVIGTAFSVIKPFLIPFVKIAAIGLLIVGAFKFVAAAFSELEERTKVFSSVYSIMVDELSKSASFFAPVVEFFSKLAENIKELAMKAFGLFVFGLAKVVAAITSLAESNPFGVFSKETIARLSEVNGKLNQFSEDLKMVAFDISKIPGEAERAIAGTAEKSTVNIEQLVQKLNTLRDAFKDFGLSDIEVIRKREDEALETLRLSYENKIMSESEYQNLRRQVIEDANIKVADLEAKAAKKRKEMLDQANKIMNSAMANALSSGIQNIVQSLAKGESIFKNFSSFIIQTFGDLAIQLGQFYIAQGLANMALLSANPGAQIATGVALVALGSIMKSFFAGGLGGGGGVAGVGQQPAPGQAAGVPNDIASPDAIDEERSKPQTNVSINVSGSLVHQEELGEFITRTLNESFGKQGVTLTDARFA
jgi:hypothetical protein